MRLVHWFLIISEAILFSCSGHSKNKPVSSLRDSIVEEYLKVIDSSGQYDTTELIYKVLKAYSSNDTIFFKKLHSDITYYRNSEWHLADSCIHQPKLQETDADEAYRFIYTAAFCPYKMNITVSKRADSSNLHFILYQLAQDTATCRIINEFDKGLTKKNWDEITTAIRKLDFWALKEGSGENALLDPDDIVVIGYQKANVAFHKSSKFNYVHRLGLTWTNLGDVFILVLHLSGSCI
jgi:hypothetical protein